jgi:hypothetical protein
VYHEKSHEYQLHHEGKTYVLTLATHSSPSLRLRKEETNHVIHNKDVSLFLVHPIKIENLTNMAPLPVLPLLHEFEDVF